jgi:hypothetical protein
MQDYRFLMTRRILEKKLCNYFLNCDNEILDTFARFCWCCVESYLFQYIIDFDDDSHS